MNSTFVLPIHTQAAAAIHRQARFAGAILIERLPRLVESLAGVGNDAARLEVELQAGRDDTHTPAFLRGRVRGSLPLVCQRCLEAFNWPLDLAVDLRLVQNEAEELKWLQQFEPYLIADDRLPLHDLVEDEVLLALPLSPRCAECAAPEAQTAA